MSKPHRAVVPIAQLTSQRQVEHGRIRLGHKKDGKPSKLNEFRFTSHDQAAIETLAELYGGVCRPWTDPKANPINQFEVLTTVNRIPVWLPTNGMDTWYESWGGQGRERQCDGLEVEVIKSDGKDSYPEMVRCICEATQNMKCKPITRLRVILPELKFAGIWRLQTGGWNAAQEMPGMMALIEQLQGDGIVSAYLSLVEQREPGRNGQPGKRYVVPKISTDATSHQILAGQAQVQALPTASHGQLSSGDMRALGPAPAPWQPEYGGDDASGGEGGRSIDDSLHGGDDAPMQFGDDDVIDAELVDDDEVATVTETPVVAKINQVLALEHAPPWGVAEFMDNMGDDAERKLAALLNGTARWSKARRGGVVKA